VFGNKATRASARRPRRVEAIDMQAKRFGYFPRAGAASMTMTRRLC